MGRLTDEMTRLVREIHAARGDRRRLMRDLKHATAEMKRAVAHLRSSFAAELAGGRAAWFGAMAPVPRKGAGTPETAAPGGEREDVLREPAEQRRRLKAKRPARGAARPVRKAKRPARDKARTVRKATGRHRLR